uniref:Uncharacterized protein n=1 Tax=viral metagenome TaxID=1070528 RepID=A0A6C0KU77_9ZZZZ
MTITTYTALHLVEFEDDGKKDSELIVLYDEIEENYYLYGTRRPISNAEIQNLSYEYIYDYSRLNSLVSLIMILTNNLNDYDVDPTKYSIEINNIKICDCELEILDYTYLKSKFSVHNEMVAYDNQSLDKKKLKTILKTLTSSY